MKKIIFSALIILSLIISVLFSGPFKGSFCPLVDYEDVMPRHRLSLHGIDVSQGAATLIKARDANILIDTGEKASAPELLNYLRGEDIKEIDILFITHPHKDHYGAVPELLEEVKVKSAYLPSLPESLNADDIYWDDVVRILEDSGAEIVYPHEKMEFPLGRGAELKLLGPFLEDAKNLNDLSLCFKVSCRDVSFLITGDGEKAVEEALMDEDIEADILFSGHHGSKTSSNKFFIDKVQPKASFVSVGFGNSHGLPDRVHLDNLLEYGDIFRSDLDGSVVFLTDGKDIAAVAEKTR